MNNVLLKLHISRARSIFISKLCLAMDHGLAYPVTFDESPGPGAMTGSSDSGMGLAPNMTGLPGDEKRLSSDRNLLGGRKVSAINIETNNRNAESVVKCTSLSQCHSREARTTARVGLDLRKLMPVERKTTALNSVRSRDLLN